MSKRTKEINQLIDEVNYHQSVARQYVADPSNRCEVALSKATACIKRLEDLV